MTPLDHPLKRAVHVAGKDYTLLVDPDGLKLTEKGRRKGVELQWRDLVNGDAAIAAALQASLASARKT